MRLFPLFLVLGACSSATVRDRDSASLDMIAADDGREVGAFEVIALLGPDARDMRVELQLESRGFVTDNSTIEISGLMGFTEVGSASDNDIAEFTFEPNVALCDGDGFALQSDDACEVTVAAIVVTREVISPTGAAVLRVFAEDDWSGDADAITASVSVAAIQPE